MAIPTQTQTVHHVGNTVEDISMGMRAEDFVHVAFMFENLYSNPLEAVVREYSTNAWDSHVFAGNPDPIQITLPTETSLEFSVQDFGVGMSIDTLREVYSMYGASDKRATNAVAGQLGMGSKSGLSYAAGFTVTAVKDHEKVVAFVTKDTHGLGVIKILAPPAATDEPNGVKITIPVERYHISRFREAAETLFQFWEPGTVLIDGVAPDLPAWRSTALMLDDDTFLVRKDQGLYSSYVIMGNVPYPIEDISVGRETMRIVARLNIGDVDFAPSREDVRHTTHTDATLEALAEYVNATYRRAIDTQLAAASTPWDETMVKTLWMNRMAQLKTNIDNPIWTFDPHGWNRKATRKFAYRFDALAVPNVVVVTGFPAKTISTPARERLNAFSDLSRPTFVILPAGIAGVGSLEGHPRCHSWAEIVGATDEPKVKGPKVKRDKVETQYTIRNGSPMTVYELQEIDDTILYIEPGEYTQYGDLGCTVVALYSMAQLGRLQRFLPNIEHYNVEVDRQRAAAQAAITDDDLRLLRSKQIPHVFTSFDPDKVHDPEVATYIRLAKSDLTPTIIEARRFGCDFDVKPLPDFLKRYPLLNGNHYSVNDGTIARERLFYMNAAYDAREAAKVQAVAS